MCTCSMQKPQWLSINSSFMISGLNCTCKSLRSLKSRLVKQNKISIPKYFFPPMPPRWFLDVPFLWGPLRSVDGSPEGGAGIWSKSLSREGALGSSWSFSFSNRSTARVVRLSSFDLQAGSANFFCWRKKQIIAKSCPKLHIIMYMYMYIQYRLDASYNAHAFHSFQTRLLQKLQITNRLKKVCH